MNEHTQITVPARVTVRLLIGAAQLIAIAGMFLRESCLGGPGLQHAKRNGLPNTGMADPDALINAFDRYVSGLTASGGGRFLIHPAGEFAWPDQRIIQCRRDCANRPVGWLGGFSDPRFTVRRCVRPVVDRQPVRRRPNHVCRIPGCPAQSRNLQLGIGPAYPVGDSRQSTHLRFLCGPGVRRAIESEPVELVRAHRFQHDLRSPCPSAGPIRGRRELGSWFRSQCPIDASEQLREARRPGAPAFPERKVRRQWAHVRHLSRGE